MKSPRNLIAGAAVLAALASSAWADGRNAGSVLVYPVHRSGPEFFTVISVTNSNLQPQTPSSFGGSTLVHYEYVNATPNPSNPFRPLNCTVFDRVEFLTPADHLSVLTTCHNAFNPGGQEGYLVISAQDPSQFDVAWTHNWLMGSELVVNGSGVVYGLDALPFNGLTAAHAPTDLDGDSRLDFNGLEYEPIADTLFIDAFVALTGSQLALLNLTGGPNDVNTVLFSVWNDNEFPLSTTLAFNCWFDEPLTKISQLFSEGFLKYNTPHDPSELDIHCTGKGTLETGWARLDSIDVRTPGGSLVDMDGAMLGGITAGRDVGIDAGHNLWESTATQTNGTAFNP